MNVRGASWYFENLGDCSSEKLFFEIKISKKCHTNHNFDIKNRNLVVLAGCKNGPLLVTSAVAGLACGR